MKMTDAQRLQAKEEGWTLIGGNPLALAFTPTGDIMFSSVQRAYDFIWRKGFESEFHADVIRAIGAYHPCAVRRAACSNMRNPSLATYLEQHPNDPLAKILAVRLAKDRFIEAAGDPDGNS